MKKFLAILVALSVLAGTFAITSFAAVQEDLVGNFCSKTTSTACPMSGAQFETLGAVMAIGHKFDGVYFGCPSWSENFGSITFTVWKWDTNYEKTVQANPIVPAYTAVDYEDNSWLGFKFETALDAGVYYMEMSEAVDTQGGGVGVWTGETSYAGQAVLRDGEYIPNINLRAKVDFTESFEGDAYGTLPELKKEDNGLGGDDKNPAPVHFTDFSEYVGTDSFGVSISQNEDGTFHFHVASGSMDSQYPITYSQMDPDYDLFEGVSCQEYPYIAMRIKLDAKKDFGDGECFFYTTSCQGAAGGYSGSIIYDWTTSDWQTVVIDPTANKTFQTNAVDNGDCWAGMRFDVLSGTPDQDADMDIAWIAFFADYEVAKAFDGNFEAVVYATEAPATAAPTEAPATDAPEPTTAPADATKAPDKADDDGKKGCGGFACNAGLVLSAVFAARILRKKNEE